MDTNFETNASLAADDNRAPRKVAEVAHDAIDSTAEAAHHAIDKAGPAADRWIDALRRHTAGNPLTALAIAIFVGFLLGRIL